MEKVLKKMATKRTLMLSIRKRQLSFIGHIMRNVGLTITRQRKVVSLCEWMTEQEVRALEKGEKIRYGIESFRDTAYKRRN